MGKPESLPSANVWSSASVQAPPGVVGGVSWNSGASSVTVRNLDQPQRFGQKLASIYVVGVDFLAFQVFVEPGDNVLQTFDAMDGLSGAG